MGTVAGECWDTVAVREGGGREDGWWNRSAGRVLLFWTSIRQYLMLKNIILIRWISTTLIFCYKGFFSGKCHTFVKTETLEKSKLYWKLPSRLALRILVPVQALLWALFVLDLNTSFSVLVNDRQESWSSHSGVPRWARLVWTVAVSTGFANWGSVPAHLFYLGFPLKPMNPVHPRGIDFALISLSVVCLWILSTANGLEIICWFTSK